MYCALYTKCTVVFSVQMFCYDCAMGAFTLCSDVSVPFIFLLHGCL
jgi:hypothetical protein